MFQSSFIWIIPESRNALATRLSDTLFQSSFIWIIPESPITTASKKNKATVSILLHLDHSRKPTGSSGRSWPRASFNPPSSGSFPKAPPPAYIYAG